MTEVKTMLKVEVFKMGTKNFEWKKLLLGLKRPAIAFIAFGITCLTVEPQWAWVGGLSAERIFSTIEYYLLKE